jgi:hypothetical protein
MNLKTFSIKIFIFSKIYEQTEIFYDKIKFGQLIIIL